MNWEAIGAIGELLGAIGVIATLGLHGTEGISLRIVGSSIVYLLRI